MSTQANYDAIMETKAAEAELVELQPEIDNSQVLKDDLSTTTQVAEFRTWAWFVAYAMNVVYDFFAQLKRDILEIENAKEPLTDGWWKATILDFQENYELQWNASKRRYEYSDVISDAAMAARVVKFCSIGEFESTILIKCAAADSAGLPLQLTTDQILKVQKYGKQLRPPGTVVSVISREPDLIKVTGTIFYDPLTDFAVMQAAVEAIINDYDNYLSFDGKYNITKLTDNIQKVTGVTDPFNIQVYYKYGLLSYTQVVRQYQTSAGYVMVDPASPLSTTLIYTQDV